jgi:hypothetical protein
MLAFYLLGIPFSDGMLVGRQVPLVGSPVVSIKAGYAKGHQQFLQLQKYDVFSISEYIRDNMPRVVIDRVPEPALVLLAADKAPHSVNLNRLNLLNFNDNIVTRGPFQELAIDRL